MEAREPYDPKEVGKRAKAVREAYGLRVTDLADFLNTGSNNIANWESGRQRPGIQHAANMVKRFHITLDWLYLGREDTLPFGVPKKLVSSGYKVED